MAYKDQLTRIAALRDQINKNMQDIVDCNVQIGEIKAGVQEDVKKQIAFLKESIENYKDRAKEVKKA